MEHHPSDSVTTTTRQAGSDNNNTALDIDDLVPHSDTDGNSRPNPSASTPRSTSTRKRKRSALQEPTLDDDGLEGKRLKRMVDDGLSPECAKVLLDATTSPTTLTRYRRVQRSFVTWMRAGGKDPDKYDAPTIVDYLYRGWRTLSWRPQSINTNKCAILALYQEDNTVFNNHHYYKQLLALVKRRDLKMIKNIPVDISPVLSLFKSWGPNDTLPLDDL
ncbi:hypothetical protein BGX33_003451, partial [Mortierella sp. NVP41]